ncbi:MAG: hypothetical protein GY772_21630 [bacterium]|nr:hypothetical protein [bacterium]
MTSAAAQGRPCAAVNAVTAVLVAFGLSLWVWRFFAPVFDVMAATHLSLEVLSVLLIPNPWLLRALGHEEFGVLSEVSKTVKNMLADAFLGFSFKTSSTS